MKYRVLNVIKSSERGKVVGYDLEDDNSRKYSVMKYVVEELANRGLMHNVQLQKNKSSVAVRITSKYGSRVKRKRGSALEFDRTYYTLLGLAVNAIDLPKLLYYDYVKPTDILFVYLEGILIPVGSVRDLADLVLQYSFTEYLREEDKCKKRGLWVVRSGGSSSCSFKPLHIYKMLPDYYYYRLKQDDDAMVCCEALVEASSYSDLFTDNVFDESYTSLERLAGDTRYQVYCLKSSTNNLYYGFSSYVYRLMEDFSKDIWYSCEVDWGRGITFDGFKSNDPDAVMPLHFEKAGITKDTIKREHLSDFSTKPIKVMRSLGTAFLDDPAKPYKYGRIDEAQNIQVKKCGVEAPVENTGIYTRMLIENKHTRLKYWCEEFFWVDYVGIKREELVDDDDGLGFLF